MAGTCQHSDVFRWYAIFLSEVFGHDNIVVGYDSFDSGNDKFIFNLVTELSEFRVSARLRAKENAFLRTKTEKRKQAFNAPSCRSQDRNGL